MNYDAYCSSIQRVSPWAGVVMGGALGGAWGLTHIGIGAGLFLGACGAFAGLLIGAILSWLLVPHFMLLSLGVLAAAALPFGMIWLAGLLWHLR